MRLRLAASRRRNSSIAFATAQLYCLAGTLAAGTYLTLLFGASEFHHLTVEVRHLNAHAPGRPEVAPRYHPAGGHSA
jgi:hypothetical protein